MDVNLIPWTQDGIAGCYLRRLDSNGDPAGLLYKMEGMNTFDSQRNAPERTLLGDNNTYIKNSKFNDFAVTANFYGLTPDLMDCFLAGSLEVDGDVATFTETVTGQPSKVALYQISDSVGKNGETGQTLEIFSNCQVTNLGNPKTSGEMGAWQATISALAKDNVARVFKFYKGGTVPLSAMGGGSDTTPPTVSSTTPAQADTSVDVSTNITVVFSEDVDEGSLAHVRLKKLSDGTEHNIGTPTYDSESFTAVWDPPTNLSASSLYLLTVEGGKVKDIAGNYLAADVDRTFTTA